MSNCEFFFFLWFEDRTNRLSNAHNTATVLIIICLSILLYHHNTNILSLPKLCLRSCKRNWGGEYLSLLGRGDTRYHRASSFPPFWSSTPPSLSGSSHPRRARLPDPEEEGIMLLRNVSNYMSKDMASQPRRPLSFSSRDELQEPHISQEDRILYTL